MKRLYKHKGKFIASILFLLAYYFLFIYVPLPSDEEMIAHFKANRTEFEEIVKRYRNYDAGPKGFHSEWRNKDDTDEILKTVGIRRITSSYPWLPNHYSKETKQLFKQQLKNGLYHKMRHKHSVLIVKPFPRSRYYSKNLYYVNVWKSYVYFPEEPRITKGRLVWRIDKNEKPISSRVEDSLDHFPDDWDRFESVYRQIGPQWFLVLSNGH